MFEESLHIARRTQFFILLSAIVFSVFALSVQPLNKLYNRALSQVETAIAIEWNDYLPWVTEKFEQAKSGLDNTEAVKFYFGQKAQDRPIEEAWKMMEPFIKMHHLALQNRETLKTLRGELNFANTMTFRAESIPTHLSAPITNSPLDIIRLTQSAKTQKEAIMYSISRINTEQAVWKILYDSSVSHGRYKHEVIATEINFRVNTTLVEPELEDGAYPELLPWGKLYLYGDLVTPESRQGQTHSTKLKSDDYEDIKVEADKKTIERSSITDWLAEIYPGLGVKPNGHLSPFYGIEHVWREIADRPLSDAALYVQALAAEERRQNNQVNVFGINIPSQLVPIVGPLTILLLVCYLSRIITHIQEHANRYADVLSEFPWLVLNAKNVWWLDPLFSFFVFPLITQYIIMTKFRDTGIWLYTGWIFTALTLLVGGRVWQQLHLLRQSKTNPN